MYAHFDRFSLQLTRFQAGKGFHSVESLFEALESLAPSGYYFGSHPWDGTDFGFWECESWLEEDSL